MEEPGPGAAGRDSVQEAVDIVARAVGEQLQRRASREGIPARIMDPFAVGYLMGYCDTVGQSRDLPPLFQGGPLVPGEEVFRAACFAIFGTALGMGVYSKRPNLRPPSEEEREGWEQGERDARAELGQEALDLRAGDNQRALSAYVYDGSR